MSKRILSNLSRQVELASTLRVKLGKSEVDLINKIKSLLVYKNKLIFQLDKSKRTRQQWEVVLRKSEIKHLNSERLREIFNHFQWLKSEKKLLNNYSDKLENVIKQINKILTEENKKLSDIKYKKKLLKETIRRSAKKIYLAKNVLEETERGERYVTNSIRCF